MFICFRGVVGFSHYFTQMPYEVLSLSTVHMVKLAVLCIVCSPLLLHSGGLGPCYEGWWREIFAQSNQMGYISTFCTRSVTAGIWLICFEQHPDFCPSLPVMQIKLNWIFQQCEFLFRSIQWLFYPIPGISVVDNCIGFDTPKHDTYHNIYR